MRSALRPLDLLHVGAACMLGAVAFIPYVAVGEQSYAAIGFLGRVNALAGTSVIEGSWMIPPGLALLASLFAVVSLTLPWRHRTKGQVCVVVLATMSAVMTFRFTNQSALLEPRIGPNILLVGAAMSLAAIAVEGRRGESRPHLGGLGGPALDG